MNILVINYEYPPVGGGGGVICRDIAEEIVKKGRRVDVITSHYSGLMEKEEVNGVRINRVPVLFRNNQNVASIFSMLSYVPSSIKEAYSLLDARRYDVLNTHFAIPSGPAGNFISKKFKIPNVLSIHGGDIFDPSKSYSPHKTVGLKQMVRKMLKRADRVVAQSTDTRNNAKTIYSVDRDIDIVPLGIRPSPYDTVTRERLGLPSNRFIFSTIGRLVRRKNLEDLLHVVHELGETFPALLLIMGDGPGKSNIEKKVSELRLHDKVMLMGRVSDEEKFQYLAASDVYVSTAIHEGFGIVFLEAMECGLPVVCYDRGGQVDFLESGVTGFLVPLGKRDIFRERLIELFHNGNFRGEIRSRNKEYVKQFYISNCASRYVAIFEEAIASKR